MTPDPVEEKDTPEAPENDQQPEEELSIEEQLAAVEEQAAEYREGWQRAVAEMSNLKKRVERDRVQAEIDTREKLVKGMLTVLDDFDLALQNVPEDLAGHDWVEGVVAIRRKMLIELEKLDVEPVSPEPGDEFDPNLHEAVSQQPSDDYDSGQIVTVLRKGYMLRERLIRPALVLVAS